MLGPRQQAILAALDDHPAGVVVEVLLAEVSARPTPQERAKLLNALRRLAAASLVSLAGKRCRTEIAGALVMRSLRACGTPSNYSLPAGQVSSSA